MTATAVAPALAGLMMDRSLQISRLIDHAALWHADVEIVTQRSGAPDQRSTYRKWRAPAHSWRTRSQSGSASPPGARRDVRLEHAASPGALLRRLWQRRRAAHGQPAPVCAADRVLINHAGDRFVFVDADLVPVLEPLAAQLPAVEGYVVLCGEAEMPRTSLPERPSRTSRSSPDCPARSSGPSSTSAPHRRCCYTSGTTGNPKGVLLLAPLDGAAHVRAGRHRGRPVRDRSDDSSGRPAVPCQRVGAAVTWRRCRARSSSFADPHLDPAELYGALETRAGDADLRRADDLAAAARVSRPQPACVSPASSCWESADRRRRAR